MGGFIAYMIEASLFLSLLFAAYKLALGRQKCYPLMRTLLLLIYPLSLLLPACLKLNSFAGKEAEGIDLSGFIMAASHTEFAETSHSLTAGDIVVAVGAAGMVLTAIVTAAGLLKILGIKMRSERVRIEGTTAYVVSNGSLSPFSFGKSIYLSRKDYEEKEPMLLAHELSHIRLYHWVDLLAARIICILQWWNPLAWIMAKELHAVHEFQADKAVMDAGYEMKEYQYFLIGKAAGTRLQTLADSLNHSKLKTRLTMMKKENSNVRRQLAALLMIPAAAIGLSVLSIPAVASLTEEIRDAEIIFPRHAEVAGKVSEKIPNEKMQGEIRPQAARTASTPLSLNRPSAITGQEKEAESCPAAETSAVSDDEGTAQI
ncbi:MAG: M56 family metallopeptidase, partial [Muribaculaceae bacterium]|nr:M56 family metallopeptidase [Muribaculaceae bacterium]